jgi:hypothetical protein
MEAGFEVYCTIVPWPRKFSGRSIVMIAQGGIAEAAFDAVDGTLLQNRLHLLLQTKVLPRYTDQAFYAKV